MDRLAANRARRRKSPALLHFRRFLAHPVRLSSALPVSKAVARMVAARIDPAGDGYIVELGSGTGVVTRALLEAGVPAGKLIAVEIDDELAGYLSEILPDITMIHGSATDIERLLPAEAGGQVGAVICGVPVSMLAADEQRAMIEAMLALEPHDGRFLAYSYRLGSPLRASRLGLTAERLDFTLRNVFPASVWAFRAAPAGRERQEGSVK